jgi:hypothetical protein
MLRVPPLSLVLACSRHHLVLVVTLRMPNILREWFQAQQVRAALLTPDSAQQSCAQTVMLLLQQQLSMRCQSNLWCTKPRLKEAAAAQPDSCSCTAT